MSLLTKEPRLFHLLIQMAVFYEVTFERKNSPIYNGISKARKSGRLRFTVHE